MWQIFVILGCGVILGCDFLKKGRSDVMNQPEGCDNVVQPPSMGHVDPDSYKVFHNLWLRHLRGRQPESWLAKWMDDKASNVDSTRFYLGAAERFFRPWCDGRLAGHDDERRVYLDASTRFFKTYYDRSPNPSNDGIMVLLAGLAPADIGETALMSGIGAFVDPTEQKSAARDETSQFSQLLKAAYYYNCAALKADAGNRFKRKWKGVQLEASSAKEVRNNLDKMQNIFSAIKRGELSSRQKDMYDAVSEASRSLRSFV